MSLIGFLLENGIDEKQLRLFFTGNISHWLSGERIEHTHARTEEDRLAKGERRRVDYFHQSDHPYYQLTAQILPKLIAHYNVDFVPHLVGCQDSKKSPIVKLDSYLQHLRQDTIAIAPFYQLEFPNIDQQPEPLLKRLADRILTRAIADGTFLELAVSVGKALWANDSNALESYSKASQANTNDEIGRAEGLRVNLGSVYSSMFYYCDEWFFGVDRIHHRESRLVKQDARNPDTIGVVAPLPKEVGYQCTDNGDTALEFFISVRNPDGAIVIPRLMNLVERTGITLRVRPILPVTMRESDVNETRKQEVVNQYAHAGREARYHGLSYGDVFDCTGTPITNCYSLFPWATEQGKSLDLIVAFMKCVFFRSVDMATDTGMQTAMEQAGLNWKQAERIMGNVGWEPQIEKNLHDISHTGLQFGMCFELSGGEYPALVVRGQDRLFLLEADIKIRARKE